MREQNKERCTGRKRESSDVQGWPLPATLPIGRLTAMLTIPSIPPSIYPSLPSHSVSPAPLYTHSYYIIDHPTPECLPTLTPPSSFLHTPSLSLYTLPLSVTLSPSLTLFLSTLIFSLHPLTLPNSHSHSLFLSTPSFLLPLPSLIYPSPSPIHSHLPFLLSPYPLHPFISSSPPPLIPSLLPLHILPSPFSLSFYSLPPSAPPRRYCGTVYLINHYATLGSSRELSATAPLPVPSFSTLRFTCFLFCFWFESAFVLKDPLHFRPPPPHVIS